MNKVILMGRLTRDPELRYTPNNNTPVCNFTLAVDRRFQRQGEERQTDFIPVTAWGKLAQFCDRYLRKGRQIAIVGRIQVSSWDDADGRKRYKTDVVAEEAYFADSKPSDSGYGIETGGRDELPGGSGKDFADDQNDGFYPIDDDDELPF